MSKKMEKYGFRAIILHEFKLGHNIIAATANIQKAWGEDAPKETLIHRWYDKFADGDFDLDVEPPPQRRRTTVSAPKVEKISEKPQRMRATSDASRYMFANKGIHL
ncbi:unnamed protein product [Anisakis simplex]|uniref:HTH_48 domain-containing protein n=1 Tax=Anisakis simplex TaxID=6269 RepID=A0A0M3KJ90_ANISI|nr:unnamed protein product [Anisakis simplex]